MQIGVPLKEKKMTSTSWRFGPPTKQVELIFFLKVECKKMVDQLLVDWAANNFLDQIVLDDLKNAL
jgi:hypothetical protein